MAAELSAGLVAHSEERGLPWSALRGRYLNAKRQYDIQKGITLDLTLLCALARLGIPLGDAGDERSWCLYQLVPETAVVAELHSIV